MKELLQRFVDEDVRRFKAPGPSKAMNPGLWKFFRRSLARLNPAGSFQTSRLFFGEEMTVVLPEVISESLFMYGFFDEIVTALVLRSVRPGDVVVDVGAHFGYFSRLCGHLAGPTGKVYSFEPNPRTFQILKKNAEGSGNLQVFNAAAGAEAGTLEMVDFGLTHCAWNSVSKTPRKTDFKNAPPPQTVNVQVLRLDDYFNEKNIHPTVIKVDAEDFELQVIRGLEQTLKLDGPRVIMESGSDSTLEAARLLVQAGYAVYVADDPRRLALWTGSIEQANADYKDLLFSKEQMEVEA